MISDAIESSSIERQLKKFDEARDYFINNYDKITRMDWEELFQLESPPSTEELWSLKAKQIVRAAQAKAAARQASVISLNKIRKEKKWEQFCAELPKGAMLHIHPWGTVDRPTLNRILETVDVNIPIGSLQQDLLPEEGVKKPQEMAPEELAFLDQFENNISFKDFKNSPQEGDHLERFYDLYFLPEGRNTFERFLGVFTVISSTLFQDFNKSEERDAIMWESFLHRAARHHVSYVEVTNYIRLWEEEKVERLAVWAEDLEKKTGVKIRLLLAFNRMVNPKGIQRNNRTMESLLELGDHPVIRGINMQNMEDGYAALDIGQGVYGRLLKAKKEGRSRLGASMHAGELGLTENVRDAIIFGVDRLGHGVALKDDPLFLEYASRKKIGIETNLVSNLRLGIVDSMKDHPFLMFHRLGMKVSLSTDDEGIFESDISDECELAIEHTDIQYSELKQMMFHSIESSFANQLEKLELEANLHRDFANFEERWVELRDPQAQFLQN